MTYRMTQTLLSAWQYAHLCSSEHEAEATDRFLRTLCRLPNPSTRAMRDGTAFEREVYRAVAGEVREAHPTWERGIRGVSEALKGAQIQVRAERGCTVYGHRLSVYGILDALRAGEICDVKFSSRKFAHTDVVGKYFGSVQHATYLFLLPEARCFTYLISDGEDVYTEGYTRKTTPPFEALAAEFLRSLEETGRLSLYEEHWKTATE